jgi:hypothetical protein
LGNKIGSIGDLFNISLGVLETEANIVFDVPHDAKIENFITDNDLPVLSIDIADEN